VKSEEEKVLHRKNARSPETVIEAEHLQKSFGKKRVLRDVSFVLHKRENLVVLGKSGTGKSVLIKCIVGLLRPDSGRLTVLGQDVADLTEDEWTQLRKKVGFLFQGGALYDSMTVRQNLEFPLKRLTEKPSKAEMKDAVENILENVGLKDSINKMPAELSGGMKKRIALARTLITKPEIVLYDEPTTGLDPVTSREISELILEMQQRYEISSIIITHDMGCARTTAERMLILREGLIEAEGTFEELESSEVDWVRSFFI
jgi:phospholipid/cholesterol/gamma-HCH transport system ATP-binding protein